MSPKARREILDAAPEEGAGDPAARLVAPVLSGGRSDPAR
jgi:hypothetical protein